MIELKPCFAYVVIRHCCDGFQFMDLQSLSYDRAQAQVNADMLDKALPFWAKDNFQVKMVRVKLEVQNDRSFNSC